MRSNSIVSTKSQFQSGIIVKATFIHTTAGRSERKDVASTSNGQRAKAKIVNLFESETPNKSQRAQLTYTIQQGDKERLNKHGVLRVYNIKEAIDIPVTALLGKWKDSHVGVTLCTIDEEWKIVGGVIENIIPTEDKSILRVFQSISNFLFA